MSVKHYRDIHSHLRPGERPREDTVYSLMPAEWAAAPAGGHFSVGVHPMYATAADADQQMRAVEDVSTDPRIVAIGECGLDRRSVLPVALQEDLLRRHAQLALKRGLPLIIHCVGHYDVLTRVLRPFIKEGLHAVVHGYRRGPELARQLLAAGLDLSFGPRRNDEAYEAVPPDRRYFDSDGSCCQTTNPDLDK